MPTVFPAPDHDHGRCSADTLKHAEALCATRGERLTPMRRHVLEVLAASHKPLGAYEIIDAVAARGPRPAPITIYRALDFLTATGPRASHREPQRVPRLRQQSCERRAGRFPDLRAMRRGRRGPLGGGDRQPERRREERGLHAEEPRDRDLRRLQHCRER